MHFVFGRHFYAGGFHVHDETIDSQRESNGRSGLSTHLFHESVVTASSSHGILSVCFFVPKLKHGLRVVIQSAHELVVLGVHNANLV